MDLSELKHLPVTDYAPAELDEASRLLLRAADAIERDGWCQNEATSPDGRMCLVGAIHYANLGQKITNNGGIDPWTRASNVAFARVEKSLDCRQPAIWNDDECRTQAEVVAKLRAVAMGGA